jgi:hypothetical protein
MVAIGLSCLFVSLIIVVIGVTNDARRAKLVREGKATYFVGIAASGKGQVYHSFRCGTNTLCVVLPLAEAQAKGYRACATCGGRGTIRLLDGSSC